MGSSGLASIAVFLFGAALIWLSFRFGKAAASTDYNAPEYDGRASGFYVAALVCFALGLAMGAVSPFVEPF
jgi:hypothetical protein